jgi:hypothetical protein
VKEFLFNYQDLVSILIGFGIMGVCFLITALLYVYSIRIKALWAVVLFLLGVFSFNGLIKTITLTQEIHPKYSVSVSSSNELILDGYLIRNDYFIKCGDFSYYECVSVVKDNLDKIIIGKETQLEAKNLKGSL